jgi:hypothetical protein
MDPDAPALAVFRRVTTDAVDAVRALCLAATFAHLTGHDPECDDALEVIEDLLILRTPRLRAALS